MFSSWGFTGPIAHWWESSFLYCGPMIDWRYEGIIAGYVTLFGATGDRYWLERAVSAAESVVEGQLPTSSFRNSSFQYGPIEGGTPHEAAVDVGLLELARSLRGGGIRADGPDWSRYFGAAERNIQAFLIGALWGGRGFRDQPIGNDALVPNKNATALEALLLYEELSGRDMSPYIEGALRVVLAAQIHEGPRAGATIHTGTGAHSLAIGIYTARSMSAVLRYYDRSPRDDLLAAAERALSFLDRLVSPSGVRFGYDRRGRAMSNPAWIAASGDVLRLAILGDRHHLTPPGLVDRLTDLILGHQMPTGGVPTAYGFADKGLATAHSGLPEFRDMLPVVGWCDKAFRALALLVDQPVGGPRATIQPITRACTWRGRVVTYAETDSAIELRDEPSGRPRYRWRKGEVWPDIYAL
jgi:hypothetical protein